MKYVSALIFTIFPTLATAEVFVCNQQQDDFLLAFAVEREGEISTLGWYDLPGQGCTEDLVGAAQFENVSFSDATSLWLHVRDERSDPSHTLGQDLELCVDDFFDVFVADFADSTCEKRGYVTATYTQVPMQTHGIIEVTTDGFR